LRPPRRPRTSACESRARTTRSSRAPRCAPIRASSTWTGSRITATSAAAALEIPTGGAWSGLGHGVDTIRAEAHAFADNDFHELRTTNRSQAVGVCGAELQAGDDVLLLVAICDVGPAPLDACRNEPVLSLGLSVPSTVAPGAPSKASVVEYAVDGTPSPVAGATVCGGDAPATTSEAGVAIVTAGAGGPRTLQATKAGRVRSASEQICATIAADALCGSAAPFVPAASTCPTTGRNGRCGTRDLTAPAASIRGIAEGRILGRAFGPRERHVTVDPDPSGPLAVKLRLTRTDHGRCSYSSGRSEHVVRAGHGRCHARHGLWFGVGDREQTSHLLPGRLPRGRCVIDAVAIDRADNRGDARRRGFDRFVFDVG
jgi:hypothetical protein